MEALASDNLALPLKFSLFVKFVLLIIKKPEKNRGYKGSFLAICNFVFSSCISNLVFSFRLTSFSGVKVL